MTHLCVGRQRSGLCQKGNIRYGTDIYDGIDKKHLAYKVKSEPY